MNESTNFQVPRSLALTPPPHSSHDYLPNLLYININSVRRWNGPGQLEVPPQSSLSYFRAIGATTSPVRTYCSR